MWKVPHRITNRLRVKSKMQRDMEITLEWVMVNTKGRFWYSEMIETWYFERQEDAALFKLFHHGK
jgi:hypothetical protein